MDLIQAFVLGVIQGLTEFLPISSTAHIRVVPALLGWADPGAPFTAVIQIGTVIAVLAYFRKELWVAFSAWIASLVGRNARENPDARMGWAIVVGTVPIVVLGVLFKDRIENELRSLYVIATALIGMGVVLGAAELIGQRTRSIGSVRWVDGLFVGLWQAIALIPGASRSGSTISGALFAGFDRPTAARFSFLLSVPSVVAAALFSAYKHRREMQEMLPEVLVANAAALLTGYLAIAGLMYLLERRSTLIFVAYRILGGAAILGLLWSGVLQANS